MEVTKMKPEDFDSVPTWTIWKGDPPAKPFCSVVIIPTDKFHTTGFRIMNFVFCNERQEPICRVNGISDTIHIDGIGGTGLPFPNIAKRPPAEWMIDCLPCGYLRIYCRGTITCGYPVSDFEIFWNELP